MCVLPGAGRAPEQQAAAQVAARRQQRVAVAGRAEHVELDLLEQPGGQHQVLAGHLGALEEDQPPPAARAGLDGDQLSPEHVVGPHQGAQVGQGGLGPALVRGQRLEHEAGWPIISPRRTNRQNGPFGAVTSTRP